MIRSLYRSNFSYVKFLNNRRLNTIALRREDKSRWERRVSLTPDDVSKLIKETGTKIYLQPCNKRIFSDEKYKQAGAIIQEDISVADVIMGIKEVPTKNLIPNKTYIFFSHTHKGQIYNMAMLQDILDKKIRLIDYELMTNEDKKRLVLFGTHAGYAGMVDGLHGLGLRLLGLGYNTPFMHVAMSHSYKSLDAAKSSIKDVGESIVSDGLPKEFGPMTFVFTGTGHVSNGAQEIFKHLPHEYIDAKDLKECTLSPHNFSNKKVYGCQVKLHDYLFHKSTRNFVSREDYYANPDDYVCEFHTKIAKYTTMLIHGSYWDPRFPRLITNEHLKLIQEDPNNKYKLLAVADISCDIVGALEFLSHSTTIDDPFYYVDAVNKVEHKDDEGKGTQMMAVDILPTEIPLESSKHFSKSLYPFMKDLIYGNIDQNPILSGATITKDGKLTDSHKGLYDLLPKNILNSTSTSNSQKDKKKILLLGSGFVAKPFIDHLSKQNDLSLTIASNMKAQATALTGGNPDIQIFELDVYKKEELSKLIQGTDIVVSFIPASLHPIVAEMCITYKKNMVTASYISPEMKALDERANQAGITILNEIGVDPGIDHLSAMKVIDEVKAEGGEITSFVSWCGGLPAPENADVPLSYKFSWSPKGALTSALNDAKFWMNGKYQEIPGKELLKSYFPTVTIGELEFEGLANRNSLSYVNAYGLAPLETKNAIFRGTLRHKGFSDLMYSFYKLGFLDTENTENVKYLTWSDFLDYKLFETYHSKPTEASRISAIADKLNLSKNHQMVEKVVDALKWLSLMPNSNTPSSFIPFTANTSTPLDTFCSLLQQTLKYNPGERDLLVLHHNFGIKLKDGTEQTKTSTLECYGSLDTTTAMAQLVGLPAAIATEMIARGEIRDTGILAPTLPHIYNPILYNLDLKGIKIKENVINSNEMEGSLNWNGSGIWQ